MAKKGYFFGPGGPNFDPFFTIFCKSLLNMPKNIILKNKKKIGPGGPNFEPFSTIFCKSLLNMPPPKNCYTPDLVFPGASYK